MDCRWSVVFALWILGAVAAPPREVYRREVDCGESCTESELTAEGTMKSTEVESAGTPSESNGFDESLRSTLEPTLQPEFIISTNSHIQTERPRPQPTLQNAPSILIEDVASDSTVKEDDSDSGDDQPKNDDRTSSDSISLEHTPETVSTISFEENQFKSIENKESLETHEKLHPQIIPGDLSEKSDSSASVEKDSETASPTRDTNYHSSTNEERTTTSSEVNVEGKDSTSLDKSQPPESEGDVGNNYHLRSPDELQSENASPSTETAISSNDQVEEGTSTITDEHAKTEATFTDFSTARSTSGTSGSESKESSEVPSEGSDDITDATKLDAPALNIHETVGSSESSIELTSTSTIGEGTADPITSTTSDFKDENQALGIMEEKAADIKTHGMMKNDGNPVDSGEQPPPSDNVADMAKPKDPNDKYISGANHDLVAAVQFLHYDDKESSEQCNKLVSAHWDYATNLTEHNKQRQIAQTLEFSRYHKEAWKNATSFAWKSFNDTVLRRWFKKLSILGNSALSEEKLEKLHQLEAEMEGIYSTAKVCSYKSNESSAEQTSNSTASCNVPLEPDLTRILTKSRDYDELLHVWKAWRDAAGKPIREKYWEFIQISNEAARLNGFQDTGEMWREPYESDTFEQDLQKLWEQLRPLYENLHAYVRRKLISRYGSDKIKENGPIPAHLLGNMWAQSWGNLMDIVQPYAGKPSIDITPTMEAKNMTVLEMFQRSEEFFISLGLKPMPEKFWNNSMIVKPEDREVICHASAWDFCNGEDFRIKQCTDITMDDLVTVHHEMGHIQYYLQYAKQPNIFREGANPGFHEAIGDVLALSVATPKHLHSIGMLEEVADDPEGDLNFLMSLALDKAAFLPFGYLIDNWRWGVFSGDIKKEEMNKKWWELRLKYQGVCPPVLRTEDDFDPGAKYHVPGNTPYIRYFVSSIIQFQMHKSLCDASGHTGPLHKCDIYRSKAAGQILSDVMELGSSENWSEAMKIMTGGSTDKMDAGPILEYFDPLLKFLEQQNMNETLGWKSDNPVLCP